MSTTTVVETSDFYSFEGIVKLFENTCGSVDVSGLRGET
jgi:hypothetical protein